MIKFKQYIGNTGNLPTDKNHLNFKWLEPECKVLFSISKQGKGASCHFSSDKAGMKKIKQAINEFVIFVFENFSWCEMIMAKIKLKKIEKIVVKCGFDWTLSTEKYTLYTRKKSWVL